MDDTSKVQFYLHIGIPKTATTYLQRRVFPNVSGIDYWPVFHHPVSKAIEQMPNSNALCYDEELESLIAGLRNTSAASKVLISFEGLFGSYANNYKSALGNAHLLKENFGEAKIILIIRRQTDVIVSNYIQLVKEGYSGSFERYTGYRKGKFQFNRHESAVSLNIGSLKWSKYIAHYQELFGKTNVCVLPYELLRADASAFSERLKNFMGLGDFPDLSTNSSVNPSLSASGLWITRLLNKFFISEISNGAGFIPKQPYFHPLNARKSKNKLIYILFLISKSISPHSVSKVFSRIDKRKPELLTTSQIELLKSFYHSDVLETQNLTGLDLTSLGY